MREAEARVLQAGLLGIYAIIAVISSYFRWSRFDREFRERAVPEIRTPSATRLVYLELPDAQALGERASEVLRDLRSVRVRRRRRMPSGRTDAKDWKIRRGPVRVRRAADQVRRTVVAPPAERRNPPRTLTRERTP